MNAGPSSNLEKFYGYKETFGENAVWVDIPQQLTFVHVTDPYNDEGSIQAPSATAICQTEPATQQIDAIWQPSDSFAPYDAQTSTYGLEALSAAASGKNYSYPAPPNAEYHRSPSTSQPPFPSLPTSSSQNLNFILNQASPDNESSPPIDPRLHADLLISSPIDGSNLSQRDRRMSRTSPGYDDRDMQFLLRHFSGGPGRWMDLFDLGQFFETVVPVKANSCPLLLYAAAALSAKALGHVDPSKKKMKDAGPTYSGEQWLHKAATLYDRAIHYLREALANETRPASSQGRQSSVRPMSSGGFGDDSVFRSPSLPSTDSDELVGTTAILCVYEFLDGSGAEWSRHLDGAKSLFDIAKDSVMAIPTGSPTLHRRQSSNQRVTNNSRRAIFWNIVRQDMLEALINKTVTRLDANDIGLWRSAGLHVDDAGFVEPSNLPTTFFPMQDDMISNAMVWLAMKLVNFTAATNEQHASLLSPTEASLHQQSLLDYWETLSHQLDVWHSGLPDGFRPASTTYPDDPHRPYLPKKWFARPMCASTMQWYHFARIQLILHRPGPPNPTKTSSRTPTSLAEANLADPVRERACRPHAREILSIALAHVDEGVRIHAVQPLYTAGWVLLSPIDDGDNDNDGGGRDAVSDLQGMRTAAAGLLRDTERDTGWATAYRVGQLYEQWGLPVGAGLEGWFGP